MSLLKSVQLNLPLIGLDSEARLPCSPDEEPKSNRIFILEKSFGVNMMVSLPIVVNTDQTKIKPLISDMINHCLQLRLIV